MSQEETDWIGNIPDAKDRKTGCGIEFSIMFPLDHEFANNPEKIIPKKALEKKGYKVVNWSVMDRKCYESYWIMSVLIFPKEYVR